MKLITWLLLALFWESATSQEFVCTVCEGGQPIGDPNGIVTTPQGQQASCSDLSFSVVHLPPNACESLQALAVAPCMCPGFDTIDSSSSEITEDTTRTEPFECSICKDGEIGNPGGLALNGAGQPTTCGALHESRASIAESECARVQAFAQVPCGCAAASEQSTNYTGMYECSICGEGTVGNPYGIVVNSRGQQRTCASLDANKTAIPMSACSTLQALAQVPCECTFSSFELNQTLVMNITNSSDVSMIDGLVSSVCSICAGGEITNPEGVITTPQGRSARCDILDANADTIPSNACARVQELAMEACGCTQPNLTQPESGLDVGATNLTIESPSFNCSVCGGGEMTIPDGIVTSRQGQTARCSALQANAGSIPENACPSLQALASAPCGCTQQETVIAVNSTEGGLESSTLDNATCYVCIGEEQKIGIPSKMITTSLGVFTCAGVYSAGLTGAIPIDHCPSIQISVTEECSCFADGPTPSPSEAPYSCSICSDGRMVTQPGGLVDVSSSLIDQKNLTCNQIETLAAQGMIDEEQCTILQQLSDLACGCMVRPSTATAATSSFVCPICGEGMVIGYPDGEVVLPNQQRMSCAGVQQRADSGIIQETQCIQIQPFVRESCECIEEDSVPTPPTASPTVYECQICGEGLRVTNPDGVVVIPTKPDRTCAVLLEAAAIGNINPSQCHLLHPFVLGPCGCADEFSDAPSDVPSFSPTAPTISPAPTGISVREDCFSDLGDIYVLESSLEDVSTKRKYILCPGRTFKMGVWTEEGEIKDGEPFLALRPNVIYQCGEDGSRFNECVLEGGDFGLASYYGVLDGIYETVDGVEIRGLTFESQNLFSVLLKAAGDITFVGCAFKGNSNNAPILIQWGGEGPEPPASEQSRALVLSGAKRYLQDAGGLNHIVTFQDCVFRDNRVGGSMSFPGIIENSHNSQLIVSNCLFQDNSYGEDGNPAPDGYAIRSFGPLTLESTCFIDNTFKNNGPILVYGAQYTASNNYVESDQSNLTCELSALFSSRDDASEENTPRCESSDAETCPFSQAPTITPTTTPSKAPTPEVEPSQPPAVPPSTVQEKEKTAVSSSVDSAWIQIKVPTIMSLILLLAFML